MWKAIGTYTADSSLLLRSHNSTKQFGQFCWARNAQRPQDSASDYREATGMSKSLFQKWPWARKPYPAGAKANSAHLMKTAEKTNRHPEGLLARQRGVDRRDLAFSHEPERFPKRARVNSIGAKKPLFMDEPGCACVDSSGTIRRLL
jgi:hypothetical protein